MKQDDAGARPILKIESNGAAAGNRMVRLVLRVHARFARPSANKSATLPCAY